MCVLFITASERPGSAAAAAERFACDGRGAVAGADLHLRFHKNQPRYSIALPSSLSSSLSLGFTRLLEISEVERQSVTRGVARPSTPADRRTRHLVCVMARTDGANCGHVVVRFIAAFQKGHMCKFVFFFAPISATCVKTEKSTRLPRSLRRVCSVLRAACVVRRAA